jgi:hypothetical protein
MAYNAPPMPAETRTSNEMKMIQTGHAGADRRVVYECNFSVDSEIAQPFMQYLRSHMREARRARERRAGRERRRGEGAGARGGRGARHGPSGGARAWAHARRGRRGEQSPWAARPCSSRRQPHAPSSRGAPPAAARPNSLQACTLEPQQPPRLTTHPPTHPLAPPLPQIVCLEEGALFDRATLSIAEQEGLYDASKALLVARYRALSRFRLQEYFDRQGEGRFNRV